MNIALAVFMIAMGVGIAFVWSLDIRAGRGYRTSGGLWQARGPGDGERMVFHWLAEYGTAAALVVGAVSLALDLAVAPILAAAALGALAYTSVNSLAWSLAHPERRAYAIPMAVGAVGALVSLVVLVSG
jgi:hypothetical protein